MIKKALLVFTCGTLLMLGTSLANNDPVSTRQNLMKSVGFATGTLGKMVKGELPYDPVTAELAMRVIYTSAVGYPTLFPEGSGDGANTEAGPKIWEDRAGFEAAFVEFQASLDAAIAADPASVEELQPLLGAVGQECTACHTEYRLQVN